MLCAHHLIIQRNIRGTKWWYRLSSWTIQRNLRVTKWETSEVQSDVMCLLLWTIQRNMRGTKWCYVLTIQRIMRGTKWCYLLTTWTIQRGTKCYMCSPQFGKGLHILLQPFRAGIFRCIWYMTTYIKSYMIYEYIQFCNCKQSSSISNQTIHLKILKQ